MSLPKIAFIGAGNMAKAIIGGLVAENYGCDNIIASAPRRETLQGVQQQFSINVTDNNTYAATWADVIVLAVKPQVLKGVVLELREYVSHNPLIISVAAGITTSSITKWLGKEHAIVRCMPNIPSQLRAGACGLYAVSSVTETQQRQADTILNAVGITRWLDHEDLLNSVTAVSGSGPAYFFLMMEAMIDAGISLGLSRECATDLTVQTALGAAMLANTSDVEIAELRRRVTSPKGTTEQAINSFEADDIRAVFARAMTACSHRAIELSELLGK